MNNWIMIKF